MITPTFTWRADDLSERENQFLGALLELHMNFTVVYRKQAEARTATLVEDVSFAIGHTIRWGNEVFPGLGITHRLAHGGG